MPEQMKPVAIDLFAGAGGFSVGLLRAGFDVLCGVDSWSRAAETYRLNFEHPCLHGDLTNISGGQIRAFAAAGDREIDLMAGGPPCQGFSIQRIGPDHDSRNSLVLEFALLVKELHPRMFLMENVPGLLGKRGSELLQAFLDRMAGAGYDVEAQVVNAADYGVPQVRKRLIVVGWRAGSLAPFKLPAAAQPGGRWKSVAEAIGDLPSPPERLSGGDDPLHKKTRMSALNRERLLHIPPGGGMEHLPVHLRVDCHKAGADKIGHRYVYGRLAADRPASTITARFDSFSRGRFAHPTEHRNITLREGARLQTFEDSFRFSGNQEEIAMLIGNAVPPVLAESLARALREHLQSPVSAGRPSSSVSPAEAHLHLVAQS